MRLSLVAISLLLLASCVEAKRVKGANAPTPNIIVIMTDDQRWDTLTPQFMPETWNKVVRNSVRFTNAFVTTSLCCPSRASFLTGNLASIHGVQRNDAALMVGPDQDTLATRLDAAGYRTGLFGKYLNFYGAGGPPYYLPPGWDVWRAMADTPPLYYGYRVITGVDSATTYGLAPEDHQTDVLRGMVVDFIDDSVALGQPFFAFVTPSAPHTAVEPWTMVAPRHEGTWASIAPHRPPSWAEADMSDKAVHMQALPVTPGQISSVDGFRILQLEALLAVDELVGAVYQRLIHHRIRQETVVVVTSDQGVFWYEHRLQGKNAPYDEAHRVPLVVSYPKAWGLNAMTETGLVTSQDVSATLAVWAGVVPPGTAGIPFTVLPPTRTLVPLEGWNPVDGTVLYTGTRTATNKLFSWWTGELEEYQLIVDPDEMESVQ